MNSRRHISLKELIVIWPLWSLWRAYKIWANTKTSTSAERVQFLLIVIVGFFKSYVLSDYSWLSLLHLQSVCRALRLEFKHLLFIAKILFLTKLVCFIWPSMPSDLYSKLLTTKNHLYCLTKSAINLCKFFFIGQYWQNWLLCLPTSNAAHLTCLSV